MTKTIEVVAAVICRDGRVLLGQRPMQKRHGGRWEFPGGKVRPGETFDEAIARELREELALDLARVDGILARIEDPGSPFRINFVAVEAAGEPLPTEHAMLGWYPPNELARMALAPADQRFAAEHLGAVP